MNATTLREMRGKATTERWHPDRLLLGNIRVSGQCDTVDMPMMSSIVECLATKQVDADGREWRTSGTTKGNRDLIVAAVNLFGPFLNVLEAAEAVTTAPVRWDGTSLLPERMRNLETAIAALYRRAGEVMDG